jgi:hypothetical protein
MQQEIYMTIIIITIAPASAAGDVHEDMTA